MGLIQGIGTDTAAGAEVTDCRRVIGVAADREV